MKPTTRHRFHIYVDGRPKYRSLQSYETHAEARRLAIIWIGNSPLGKEHNLTYDITEVTPKFGAIIPAY